MYNELNEVLRAYKAIATKNPVLPVCEGVSMQDGYFHVTDVDNQVSIKSDFPAECNGLVFYHIENAIKIKPEKIQVSGETKVSFMNGAKVVNVSANTNEDFPTFESGYAENIFIFEGIIPKLKKAIPFLSKDELRPAMNGICLTITGGKIEAVATNASFLYKSNSIFCDAVGKGRYILSPKIAKYLIGIKDVISGMASVADGRMIIEIITGDGIQISINTRLIDEKYPEYDAVIPIDNPLKFEAGKKELIEVLAEAEQFANKITHGIKIDFKKGKISAEDIGFSLEYQNDFPAKIHFDEEFLISLNAKMVIQSLKVCEGETIKFGMSGPLRAIIGHDISGDMILNMPIMMSDSY